MTNLKRVSPGLGAALWLAAILFWPAIGHAQQDRCVVRHEPGTLIRGDEIPSGCVLRLESEADRERQRFARHQPEIVFAEVPIFFIPQPKVIVLPVFVFAPAPERERVLRRRPVRHRPTGRLTRDRSDVPRLRSQNFGPLFRHFGPLFRPFGRQVRDR